MQTLFYAIDYNREYSRKILDIADFPSSFYVLICIHSSIKIWCTNCALTYLLQNSFKFHSIAMIRTNGRIFRRSKAFTMYISVPSSIVTDSKFPFSLEGEEVTIQIHGKDLIISRIGE